MVCVHSSSQVSVLCNSSGVDAYNTLSPMPCIRVFKPPAISFRESVVKPNTSTLGAGHDGRFDLIKLWGRSCDKFSEGF